VRGPQQLRVCSITRIARPPDGHCHVSLAESVICIRKFGEWMRAHTDAIAAPSGVRSTP
jgi:hypothetical protein